MEQAQNVMLWNKEVFFTCECGNCGKAYDETMMIDGPETDSELNDMVHESLTSQGWGRVLGNYLCPNCFEKIKE